MWFGDDGTNKKTGGRAELKILRLSVLEISISEV